MLKNLIAFLLLFFSTYAVLAQKELSFYDTTNFAFQTDNVINEASVFEQTIPDFKKHWTFGGNLGLSFWNDGTNILIGPKAYYNFSPKFLTGFGLSYLYSEYKYYNYSYHTNSFGGSVMAAFRPIYFLQISAEYEGLQTNYSGYYSDEYFVSALYLGLSYVTGPVSFGVRYDVLYDANKSIYSSAWNPFLGLYF